MPSTVPPHDLETLLKLKSYELDALLDVTRAVTGDFAEPQLYRIYQFTLQGQLGIRELALYWWDGASFCLKTSSFGLDIPQRAPFTQHDITLLCPDRDCELSTLPMAQAWYRFERLVPLKGVNNSVQALLFVGALHSRYSMPGSNSLDFLVTLSQILLGAVTRSRLEQQRRVSLVAESARQREAEITQQVQQRLFPQHLPNNSWAAAYATYQPHDDIGGDYYDVLEIGGDRLLLCVADVSGKGVPASLLMSNFQAGLRTLVRQGTNLANTVRELNYLIFNNSAGEKFITAFLAIYNRSTRVLEYVNAGHNDPLLLPDTGVPQRLHHGTQMLGIFDELPSLQVGLARLEPHSLLFTYTDGLTEVFDQYQQEFGEEGVLAVLQRYRYLPLPRLHHELLQSIRQFNRKGDSFADDITMLSLRAK